MRGKRHPPSPCNPVMRIIPAHAGQTVSNSSRTSARSDHPRACGANPALSVMTAAPAGSSPRMRGKRAGHRLRPRPYRIIPAHAGQTTATRCPCESPADHPRACGANLTADDAHASTAGSSPRMRGKHLFDAFRVRGGRIIPAHAGQTRLSVVTRIVWADHPRACGANTPAQTVKSSPYGSSPRMRGKLIGVRLQRFDERIIPAHAGQTHVRSCPNSRGPDHPRACGANRVTVTGGDTDSRIIPAHAGQTAR